MQELSFTNHSRVFNDYTYIYPVISRRSQGLSIGINLNINNACNWRCVYCQVEGLIRGKPVAIDLDKLEFELDNMLDAILNDGLLTKLAPVGLRRLNDICLSGNGEPTLSKQFLDVIKIIIKLRNKHKLDPLVKTLLITNGSEIDRFDIIAGIKLMNQNNGEIWFKIDRINKDSIFEVNQVNLTTSNIRKNLEISCTLCPTYIQTCWFKTNGNDPIDSEIEAYIDFVVSMKNKISGVLMYSVARKPSLKEGEKISSVDLTFLNNIAKQLEKYKILTKCHV